MPADEGAFLAGADPTSPIKTCFEAIEGSEFPSWTLCIQTMTPEQAKQYKLIAIDVKGTANNQSRSRSVLIEAKLPKNATYQTLLTSVQAPCNIVLPHIRDCLDIPS
ncbi:unnamed protein product [Peronospora farinosa]|uniref:Catalase core domain-containing protein n=1 Tax=Peronospora farinosa TaxID=134698 RepID=A0AAV0STE5_9STRA|nr:unnamed protein product [Peronospora farinosa]